mgnify:CR=1 FL=1
MTFGWFSFASRSRHALTSSGGSLARAGGVAGASPVRCSHAVSAFLCVTTALKLLVELSMFRHLRKRSHSTLKRSAILMTGELKGATGWRFG